MEILEVAQPQELRGDTLRCPLRGQSDTAPASHRQTCGWGRDGTSVNDSPGPGKEQTWPGWTDASCNSHSPPGYSPAASYSGP